MAGLQAERTSLAWTRTSAALLANGGLVLLRHLTGGGSPAHLVLAGAGLGLAVVVAVLGRVRSRTILRGEAAVVPARSLWVVGVMTTVFCVATVLVIPR